MKTDTITAPAAPRWQPTVEKEIKLPNGVTLAYVDEGDPAGVPIVMLHGYADSWRSFEGALDRLSDSFRLVSLTHRGHGNSAKPETGYAPDDLAADLAFFLDALALGPAILVGHSMGSIVALRFAIDHSDRLLGLVLVGATGRLDDNLLTRELYADVISKLEDPVDPGFIREFQTSTLAQPAVAPTIETVLAESAKVPARVLRDAFAALLETNLLDRLSVVDVPTLLVWGARDTFMTRPDQEDLIRALPRADLLVYEQAGHDPQWEEPDRFASDLAAFATFVAG
jgi:pimeloyl-ACP methyl ester carboxylesterase